MQNTIAVGISFPKKIMIQIDDKRGDIPRSKYSLRIIQGRIYPLENFNSKGEQVIVQTVSGIDISSNQSPLADAKLQNRGKEIGWE